MSDLAVEYDLLKNGTKRELIRTAECRAESNDGHSATVIVIPNGRNSRRELDPIVEVV